MIRMNLRYYNMTMKALLDLRKKKHREIEKLNMELYNPRARYEIAKLEEHLRLIEAEIISRVDRLPMFK